VDEKNPNHNQTTYEIFEEALREAKENIYVLALYITGQTPGSQRAIRNIKKICEEELKGRYELEIIDIYQQPGIVKTEKIVVTPTLIKKLPPPLRQLVGDMSDRERVLVGLNLNKK